MPRDPNNQRVWYRPEEPLMLLGVEMGMYNADQMLELLVITYRQLDYWTTKGYLHTGFNVMGSGHPRLWPESELIIAKRVVKLIDIGFAIEAAFYIARKLVPGEPLELGGGVSMVIDA